MLRPLRRALLAATLGLLVAPAARAQDAVTVFAAASLTDAMRALAQDWQSRGHPAPRLSFRDPWSSQSIEAKVEHDVGFTAIDFRGAYRNPGA